ncbi:MAG: tyrosine--tRNA ligase [Alphaproteobacteria bacterium]|nr:MAG: tyrosine--tRNA ligase [Alphaproteobacteria bacterium]
MTPKSDFLHILQARGFVQDCTDAEALDAALCAGIVPGYIGFDCTADSLHVGSLIQIMLLRWLQKTGHKPVVLMGGGTTRIGDPSGKDESRQLLSDAEIAANMAGIRKVFDSYLTFGDGPTDAIMPDNAEWLDTLNYIDFLRDYGRHFTINRMLSFDSVRLRLEREQPLTFLEFNYMLLQAYDFLELRRRFGVRLQMGGSDQWGNIVNGVELNRRVDGAQVFGLTTPLLTRADGSKMGKTASGAVWLNPDKLSPYEFWQFWRNTLDADVGKFLRRFTELPLDEIARLESLEGAELNEAKKILANEVTALAHGRAAAEAAAATAAEVFEKGGTGADLPRLRLSPDEIGEGISVVQLFVRAGLAHSGKEAKRLIAEGGARLDDTPVSDAGRMVSPGELSGGVLKLSAGKKRHALVELDRAEG